MVNVLVGRPLGDMLMCVPTRGAEAVKKMGWWRAHLVRSSERESKNLTILRVVILESSDDRPAMKLD